MATRIRIFASALLFCSIGIAWWLQSHQPRPVAITPTLTGQPEYCLTCHSDLTEISSSHPVQTYGCVICHGGERLALDANLAHSSMRGGNNPSDPTVVEQSCGGDNCHSGSAADDSDHIQRVMTSIPSTYAGAIANVRYAFGAQTDLTPLFGTKAVTDTSLPSQTSILHLDAVWQTEIHRLLPELLVQHQVEHTTTVISGSWQKQRLYESVAQVILALKQPFLLLLDDLLDPL